MVDCGNGAASLDGVLAGLEDVIDALVGAVDSMPVGACKPIDWALCSLVMARDCLSYASVAATLGRGCCDGMEDDGHSGAS